MLIPLTNGVKRLPLAKNFTCVQNQFLNDRLAIDGRILKDHPERF